MRHQHRAVLRFLAAAFVFLAVVLVVSFLLILASRSPRLPAPPPSSP
jgi:hypothetical protein